MDKIRHYKTIKELKAMDVKLLEEYMDKQLKLFDLYREQKYLIRHSKAKKVLNNKLTNIHSIK